MTEERRQTGLLARTFFARLFESELIPAGHAQVAIVVSVFAFLAAPSLILPLFLMKKYVMAAPEMVRIGLAQDRTLALLLSMIATAFISLVLWENIFPDRRDSRMLGVLPIRNRSFVVARLAAIGGMFSLLFLLTAAISSIAFALLGSMAQQPESFWRILAGHFAAVAGAEAFVFFSVVAIQCALMRVAGPSAAHRVAVGLQMVIIITVLQMPMLLPARSAFALNDAGAPLWSGTMSAALLPPLWFLSLYQSVAGVPYTGVMHLARAAALLAVLTPLLALGFYAASYARLTRLAIEGRPTARRTTAPVAGRVVRDLAARLAGTAEGAAVCAFCLRTLLRSRQHRMILAVWIGVAVALSISAALPVFVRLGMSALDRPRAGVLVGPLILAALVQTGMRSLFAIPVEIRANWAVRLGETPRLAQMVGGAAAALVLCGVLPPMLLAFATGAFFWGFGVGLSHAAFCGVLALLLVQVLMRGIDKVPFTCTYSPGKGKIGTFWPLYLTLFSMFTYGMAGTEAELLMRPRGLLIALAVLAVVATALWWLRMRRTKELHGLCFEAQPDDALTVISL